MSRVASFEKINYALRPNKNIERKLIVDILRRLRPTFPFDEYRYIGMGSLWFVDFRLIHQALRIRDMISIESEAPDRAEFNRPFHCVRVEDGDTSTVLARLDLREKRAIIWLDHDSDLRGPAIRDAAYVAERVPSGSIVAVTVNAHHGQLKNRKDMTELEALHDDVGDLMPSPIEKDALNRKGFPGTVARVLHASFVHALARSGREERFHPLINFTYQDGAPMVTVGGMIASPSEVAALEAADLGTLDYVLAAGDEPYQIEVPLLTFKEKAALDRCLPRDGGLTEDLLRTEYSFSLRDSDVEGYSRFYLHYPVFGEFLI